MIDKFDQNQPVVDALDEKLEEVYTTMNKSDAVIYEKMTTRIDRNDSLISDLRDDLSHTDSQVRYITGRLDEEVSAMRNIIKSLILAVIALLGLCILLLGLWAPVQTDTASTEPVMVTYTAPAPEPKYVEPAVKIEVTEVVEADSQTKYFDVPLDKDLQDHIFAECEAYGVDPAIVIAMIYRESRFKTDIIGDNGNSYGLMQIQPKWHQARMDKLGVTDLLNPYQNVSVGIDYLAELMARGKGVEWALTAYNGGAGYANRKLNQGVTSDYAATVMAKSEKLEVII